MKQNYSIIKLFMLTIMAFFAGNVMADEAVFDFTTSDGLKAMGIPESSIPTVEASAEAGVAFETTGPFTINGVTITATNAGDGQNTCRVWSPKGNNGAKYDYRVYGNKDNKNNGSLTITAPSGKNLSKIVFTTGTWNAPDISGGDLTAKEWNGNASSLTLSMNAGQCQFKTITVTFADAGSIVTKQPAGLSFSAESVEITLGESSFTAPTLTKATTAEVKYSSTNEKIATVDEATGAVTITATAAGTAKIRANTEENDEYYAGQAEYQIIVKEAASGIANIAAMNALENGKEFTFNGKVTVVYESGKYVYIKDNTGSSLLYKSGLNVKKGDVIKAGWEGKVSVYNNLFEVVPSTTLEKDGTAEVTYPEATVADVKAENMNQVVVLKGVTYGDINGKNFKIGTNIAGYNQFGITIPTPEEGATYDIEGVISVFKTNVQFQPISITKVSGDTPEPPKPTECANIAACYDLASGTAVVLKLNNAKVLFTWTSNNNNTQTFVRDASGAIQFYNTGLKLNEGDVLNGEVQLTYSPYKGLPELIKNDNTDAGDFGVTAGDKAEPVVITEATAAENLNDLVTMKEFTPYLDSENNRFYTSESKAIQIFNGFHLDGLDDAIAAIDTNKKYTVVGIMVKGQINVIKIEEVEGTGINDVNAENIVINTPAYNLAGQKVGNNYKGIVIKNGRKYIK